MPSVTGTTSPLINLKSFDRYKNKKYSTSTGNILREHDLEFGMGTKAINVVQIHM